jgi:CBS domain containing-hemolysin-like protein
MIPLSIFLLACAGVYLGAIEAAFGALIRLSLRLTAERTGRPDTLAVFLDNPGLLFLPVRLLLGLVTAVATVLVARLIGTAPQQLTLVIVSVTGFVILFELVLPLLIVRRNPERVLEVLLPSFSPVAKALGAVTRWTVRSAGSAWRGTAQAAQDTVAEEATSAEMAESREEAVEVENRRLLRSVVDFGDTLVREVMTPRPDIVAIRESATIGDLRALFREQEYSRFPVYRESLDNISGFVFVKDVVVLEAADDTRPVTTLLRPAAVVPESKRVAELLAQFQRQQTQCAIVVDEYGGTAGLVTIEDLLEELVGEIRDEYDVESEPIVDEGHDTFVFSGRVDIDEIERRLHVQVVREGFETVGGYLITHLGRVPLVGERFEFDGLTVEILDVERRRIHKARISRTIPQETASAVEHLPKAATAERATR